MDRAAGTRREYPITAIRPQAKKGEYTGPLERRTFEEVAKLFLDDRRANNRRMSTLEEYQTELNIRLWPRPNEKLPLLGSRDIRNIKRADMQAHFNALRNSGCTVSQVNKSIEAAKAIFTYAFDLECVASSIMQRYPKLQRVEGEPSANRGVFTRAVFDWSLRSTVVAGQIGFSECWNVGSPSMRP
jgi:hypothetical protein